MKDEKKDLKEHIKDLDTIQEYKEIRDKLIEDMCIYANRLESILYNLKTVDEFLDKKFLNKNYSENAYAYYFNKNYVKLLNKLHGIGFIFND